MNKSVLIICLAKRFPQLTLQDTDAAVNTILHAMKSALAVGQRIEVRGFGSFFAVNRPPRLGRNPKTGEKVAVTGKRVPQFRCSKQLCALVEEKPD